MTLRQFDTVVLLRDLPDEGLAAGAQGAILLVFDEPERAYEVEFCDPEGRTVAEVILRPADVARAT